MGWTLGAARSCHLSASRWSEVFASGCRRRSTIAARQRSSTCHLVRSTRVSQLHVQAMPHQTSHLIQTERR
eukprot:6169871-Amphidinium_carterae.1